PGDEIRDYGIHGYPVARDEDAGLAGGAEVRSQAAFAHAPLDREGGVHLADRAISAHRQQAPPGPLAAGANRELPGPFAGIEQRSPIASGGSHDVRILTQLLMKAGNHM